MSELPTLLDLVMLQTMNGAELGVLRRAIPADEALAALQTEQTRAALGEYGMGVVVFLRESGKPTISELPTDGVLVAVAAELVAARATHAPIHSGHEAVGVLDEEFDEVKKEVYRKQLHRARLRKELIQLAAMAVRAVEDLEL